MFAAHDDKKRRNVALLTLRMPESPDVGGCLHFSNSGTSTRGDSRAEALSHMCARSWPEASQPMVAMLQFRHFGLTARALLRSAPDDEKLRSNSAKRQSASVRIPTSSHARYGRVSRKSFLRALTVQCLSLLPQGMRGTSLFTFFTGCVLLQERERWTWPGSASAFASRIAELRVLIPWTSNGSCEETRQYESDLVGDRVKSES